MPFIDLGRSTAPLREAIDAALRRVLEASRFILGPEGEALEAEIAARCGTRFGIGVASGTDALLLVYRALDLGRLDEVVTPAFSFFASAGTVINAGARPVLADIDPLTFTIDPEAAAAAVTDHTRVVCPVHLYGQTANVERLRSALRGRDLLILEDAAQSLGARQGGIPCGSLGEAAALSFFPTKNLGGIGDGGMIVTSVEPLAARVRALRHHGQTGLYEHAWVGTNSRLDEIQAAVLRVKLGLLDAWTEERRAIARRYREMFAGARIEVGEDGVLGEAAVALPCARPDAFHVYNLFTLRAKDRDGLRRHLTEQGIATGVYYPLSLHLQPCFVSLGYRPGEFPHAERASREVLSLPGFPGLTEAEMERVVNAVTAFYARGAGGR